MEEKRKTTLVDFQALIPYNEDNVREDFINCLV
jgi:hypothetical protein